MPSALSYPAEAAGSAAASNDNWRVSTSYLNSSRDFQVGSNTTVSLPGGTYYFNSVQFRASPDPVSRVWHAGGGVRRTARDVQYWYGGS